MEGQQLYTELIAALSDSGWEVKTLTGEKALEDALEFIAAELQVRFNEAEPVLHRQWRDHVIMAVHKEVAGVTWLRIFKKKFFADFALPGFPG